MDCLRGYMRGRGMINSIGVLLYDTKNPPTLYRFIRLIESEQDGQKLEHDALFMDLSIDEYRSASLSDFWPLV